MRTFGGEGNTLQQTPGKVTCQDSRSIPLDANCIDFVLMSPPYCNALDYTRAHRFAIAWLADILNITFDDYTLLGRKYVGSDRGQCGRQVELTGIAEVDAIAAQVAKVDAKHGHLVALYFRDMRLVISEIGRILRSGGYAVIVVCPSNIRRISISWHEAFSLIGSSLPAEQRLHQVEIIPRIIDDHRRVLPYMNAGTQLQNRMRTEYVLVMRKGSF